MARAKLIRPTRRSTACARPYPTATPPRPRPLPSAPQWPADVTWGHLLTVAANLCLAVEVVHRVDAVIGDFQERNILVSDSCRVTLVDCDSMQFTDAAGRVFLCGVSHGNRGRWRVYILALLFAGFMSGISQNLKRTSQIDLW